MARIRTVKPELFQSETLAEVSVETERTFVGLLTQADDKGRMKDAPAVLNGSLWPLRPSHTIEDMKRDLEELIRVEMLCRYEAAGRGYLHLVTFEEHQRINRPSPSKIPACPLHDGPPSAPAAAGSGQLALAPDVAA